MNLETEIYQILKKHRLSLKKREEVIVDLLDFIKKRDEAMNYSQCCTELNTYFKKGDKVIACNKLEGTVVSSDTQTMVKVNIKGTTIGINARSLELKSI
jgi:predicted transcriptional regulator